MGDLGIRTIPTAQWFCSNGSSNRPGTRWASGILVSCSRRPGRLRAAWGLYDFLGTEHTRGHDGSVEGRGALRDGKPRRREATLGAHCFLQQSGVPADRDRPTHRPEATDRTHSSLAARGGGFPVKHRSRRAEGSPWAALGPFASQWEETPVRQSWYHSAKLLNAEKELARAALLS